MYVYFSASDLGSNLKFFFSFFDNNKKRIAIVPDANHKRVFNSFVDGDKNYNVWPKSNHGNFLINHTTSHDRCKVFYYVELFGTVSNERK